MVDFNKPDAADSNNANGGNNGSHIYEPPNSNGGNNNMSPSKDDCNIAMITHLLGIFTGFIAALIIWIVKKDESAYIGDQAKEALNFQITVMIASFVSGLLCMVLIGFLMLPAVFIINLVFCILGAIAASKGETYRYPITLRLVQ